MTGNEYICTAGGQQRQNEEGNVDCIVVDLSFVVWSSLRQKAADTRENLPEEQLAAELYTSLSDSAAQLRPDTRQLGAT